MFDPNRTIEDELLDDWNIKDVYWESVFDVSDDDEAEGFEE